MHTRLSLLMSKLFQFHLTACCGVWKQCTYCESGHRWWIRICTRYAGTTSYTIILPWIKICFSFNTINVFEESSVFSLVICESWVYTYQLSESLAFITYFISAKLFVFQEFAKVTVTTEIISSQVRGLPTLYFISPDSSKDAIRTEGLIPIQMMRDIIDNDLWWIIQLVLC